MSITIGIDVGGSTTKIVGFGEQGIISPFFVRANDQVASVYGAFGKFISETGLSLSDVRRVMITGVGASYIQKPVYGIPTGKVQEFIANGLGGLHISGYDKAMIVSMGTGTAIVRAAGPSDIRHIGGTGVGGGTLIGLADKMLNVRDISHIIELAKNGSLERVDLRVMDISKAPVPGLPPETTASNFAKHDDSVTREDIALGIINLVFQTIGMMAYFATQSGDIKDIVLIGNLTTVPQARDIFNALMKVYGMKFLIPKNAEFGTAVGAALASEYEPVN